MAENKKSFILYADQAGLFDKLPDVKAGKLIKLIFDYINDRNPDPKDILLRIAFEPIKLQLKRDLKEWDIIRQDRSNSGKLGNLKRWHRDLFDKVVDKEISLEYAEAEVINRKTSQPDRVGSQSVANIAVTVNDTVTDNVTATADASEIGSSRVKEVANEVWNDQHWKDSMCIGLSLKTEDLKKWLAQFNASVSGDHIAGFDKSKYKKLCRGWIVMQQQKGVKLESLNGMQSSGAAPLTILNQ